MNRHARPAIDGVASLLFLICWFGSGSITGMETPFNGRSQELRKAAGRTQEERKQEESDE